MWTSAGLISRGQTNPDSSCCPAGLYRGRSRAGCAACSRGMHQIRPPGRADVSRQPRPSPSHREVGRPGRRGAIGVWLGRSVRLLRAPLRPSRTPTRPLARPRRGRTIRRPAPLAAALLGASRRTAAPRRGHLSARSSCHPPRFGRSRQSRPSALRWCRGVAPSTARHRMAMRALTRRHRLLSASVLASGQTLASRPGAPRGLVRSAGAHRS